MIRKLLQTDRRKKRNCITQRQIWVHSKLLFVWKCGTRDMQCSWSRRGSCSGCTQPLLSSSSKEGESSSIFLESWKHPANYDSVKWCLGASFCVFFFFFLWFISAHFPKSHPLSGNDHFSSWIQGSTLKTERLRQNWDRTLTWSLLSLLGC